jgi:hypothetical protein
MDEIVFEPSDVNMLAALGIVESVKLFPFMLSMGELQYACDSEYRCKQFVNCLSEYYPDSQIEARQLWPIRHGHVATDVGADSSAMRRSGGARSFRR